VTVDDCKTPEIDVFEAGISDIFGLKTNKTKLTDATAELNLQIENLLIQSRFNK
jgi:hypothetical protein